MIDEELQSLNRVEFGLVEMLDELNRIEQQNGSKHVRERARSVLMHVRLFALTHDQREAT
jgi:hypothetical protein